MRVQPLSRGQRGKGTQLCPHVLRDAACHPAAWVRSTHFCSGGSRPRAGWGVASPSAGASRWRPGVLCLMSRRVSRGLRAPSWTPSMRKGQQGHSSDHPSPGAFPSQLCLLLGSPGSAGAPSIFTPPPESRRLIPCPGAARPASRRLLTRSGGWQVGAGSTGLAKGPGMARILTRWLRAAETGHCGCAQCPFGGSERPPSTEVSGRLLNPECASPSQHLRITVEIPTDAWMRKDTAFLGN